jgi:hypothetical protein
VTFHCGWLVSYLSLSTSFQFPFASEPPTALKFMILSRHC